MKHPELNDQGICTCTLGERCCIHENESFHEWYERTVVPFKKKEVKDEKLGDGSNSEEGLD